METEEDFDQRVLSPSSDPSPSPNSPKLKRLKKMNTYVSPNPPKSNDQQLLEPDESDGLDPLFSEGVKRVLEFTGPEFDADYLWNKEMEILGLSEDIDFMKEKNKKKRKNAGVKRVAKPKPSKRKENEERKAYLAQQADFQRVMRERKSVGFKPLPMVEKPISSVLEKIRQRKMEVSRKMMSSRSALKSTKENLLENKAGDEDSTPNIKSVADADKFEAPVNEASEDKFCSSDEKTITSNNILVEETGKPFRAPVNDTQDLSSDSQTSDSHENPSNEESGSPAQDVSPSLTSLDLRLDSASADDSSSDEEESDKENNDPLPKPSSKDKFSAMGDPVKAYLDEEASEDDSDNDLLPFEDEDEENDADMEEHCDFIDTDFKETEIDRERRDQLYQTLLQQHDEIGGENLLQKRKADENEFVTYEHESDTENTLQKSNALTIKMLKQMIPQMFTDVDDGYVSSEDEVTERSLSRQHLLRKPKPGRKTEFLSVAKDDSSKEVFGRIKRLNSAPETKKKAKTPSFFDALLTKGSGIDANKSSFLRRASSHSVPSSHRNGPSTGRSFIFGRDDSRSSGPITEDSRALNKSETQVKKVVSAKFTGSQVKRGTQGSQTRGDKVANAGTSLFEILKRSSIHTDYDTQESIVDHQAVFASFKSVKNQIKVDGRT